MFNSFFFLEKDEGNVLNSLFFQKNLHLLFLYENNDNNNKLIIIIIII
jgi:hypothetical protein